MKLSLKKEMQMSKRLLDKVEVEYNLFYEEVLSFEKQEILNQLSKIRFYDNMHEYVIYNECIPKEIKKYMNNKVCILDWLWQLYLKYECFSIESWEKITEFLLLVTMRN